MADILELPSTAFYRNLALSKPERPTREIIAELKDVRMLGEDDAIARNVLFAELAVMSERVGR